MNPFRYILLASIITLASAACGTGLSVCGTQCYNTTTNSCPTDQYTGNPMLCPVNNQACNKACFQTTQYRCVNGDLQPVPASSTSTTSAGSKPTASPVVKSSTTSQVKAMTSTSPVVTSSSSVKSSTSTISPVVVTSTTQQAKASSTVSPVVTSSSTISPVVTSSSTVSPIVTSSSTPATTSSTAATSSTSSTCNTAGCGTGTCNCNGGCYSPGQYNCAVDQTTGKNVLCSGSLAACNGTCFDTTQYSCKNGAIAQGGQASSNNANQAQTSSSQAAASTSQAATPSATNAAPVVNPSPVSGGYPTQTADLRIINSCKNTLWFEARYGGAGAPIPGQSATATIALPGSYVDYTMPSTGLGGSRFWAKYGCDSNGKNCLVGDQMQYWPNPPGGCPANGCTPPVDSLFEATWGCQPGTGCNAQNPTTWFDTSQVDGWTIPYKLTPNGDTSKCDCSGTQCGFTGVDASRLDLSKCPQNEDLSMGGQYPSAVVNGVTVPLNSVDLRIINNGSVLGCLSPCKRMNWGTPYGLQQAESSGSTLWMCCPTPTPDDCQTSNGCVTPTECRAGPIVNTQYVNAVHTMAPGIYSYSYDDGVGLHACPAGVVTYTMEFCPAGSAAYPAPTV